MQTTESLNAAVPASCRLTLRKGEKLRHRTLVEGLFKEGKSFYDFPLRLTWRLLDGESLEGSFCHHTPRGIDPVQMLVTVPKKKLRHAVDRVLMRRRIREAYRLNRRELLTPRVPDEGTLSLAFVWLDKTPAPYAVVEEKMKKLLKKVAGRLEKATGGNPRTEKKGNGNNP